MSSTRAPLIPRLHRSMVGGAAVLAVSAGLAAGCTDGPPTVDDKLLGSLAASERGDIDRYVKRLDIVTRYRAQTKKLFERTQNEVELVESAKSAAEAMHSLMNARSEHAKAHVGTQVQTAATAQLAAAKARVDALAVALDHVKLRRDYMESFDIAADDAIVLSKSELEKTKVKALAAANKIDEAKLKVSEFDVAVREAKTRYSGHIEAASKVRVALVKAKQGHDETRLKVCAGAKGPAKLFLHCDDKNGAPWAMTLPEAETLDKLQENALQGRGVVPPPSQGGVKPLSNDLPGDEPPAVPATPEPPTTPPREEPTAAPPPPPAVPSPASPPPAGAQ